MVWRRDKPSQDPPVFASPDAPEPTNGRRTPSVRRSPPWLLPRSSSQMPDQRIYLTRAGKDGGDEAQWFEDGVAFIGFANIPSLEGARDYEAVHQIVTTANPGAKPRFIGNVAGQLWSFALAMQEGDLVVLPRKQTSQFAIGRVTGPYRYSKVNGQFRHTRKVEWLKTDVPRTVFEQDLLNSFGAFMTVCNIARNGAERRVLAVLQSGADPGFSPVGGPSKPTVPVTPPEPPEVAVDLAQQAHDQIVKHVQRRFTGHELSRLVEAVLTAEGWYTKLSPPGPDGGVDILAGRGSLGLDSPRLCVQVKSQNSPADVTIYRTLQGSMQTFKAEQGLLVCWGGFNRVVHTESRQGHFTVRLWDASNLIEAIYRTYERLPAEIQAELPLKRVWTLVVEDDDE